MTIRQKYLQGSDFSVPVAFLANGFGMAIAVVTVDRKTIIARRHDTTGVRVGEVDVAVVEGVHPNLDWSTVYKGPDLYRTAIRGAREELGIELLQDSITLLGFGVDAQYYQWNLVGLAVVDETAESIIESRKRGAPGKWELKSLEPIDFDPEAILSFIRREKIWSTGIATLYFALVRYYGRSQVRGRLRGCLQNSVYRELPNHGMKAGHASLAPLARTNSGKHPLFAFPEVV